MIQQKILPLMYLNLRLDYPKKKQLLVKTIRQANCSYYFANKAANAAKNGNFVYANIYSRTSSDVMDGNISEGCPEYNPMIPDVPPPIEDNPQIKLYNLLIAETRKLIPVFQRAEEEISIAVEKKERVEDELAKVQEEVKQIKGSVDSQIMQKEEKKRLALEAAKSALELAKEEKDKAEEALNSYQRVYDTIQRQPEKADELLSIMQKGGR